MNEVPLNLHQPVNPYIAGSPVTGTEMFYGREDVFSFIRRNLIGRHRDTPVVLYGQRRTGKTSVLYQLHRHLDPGYRCIFIDLHGLNLHGMGNLMLGIASTIGRGLHRDHELAVEVPDRAVFLADARAAFEAFLDRVWTVLETDHLVLMLDEVIRLDEEVRAGRLERDVFDYLRHLMQHHPRLNFIFSLGSGLEEMAKDYAFLFSVSLYHRISFLEPEAAGELITQPVRDHYLVAPHAVTRILQITSGHPYYTQLVCHCIFDLWSRSPKPMISVADVDAVMAEAIELGSANLTYVWEDSSPEEQALMAGMAAVMRRGTDPVTIDQVRDAWHKVSVSLPTHEVAQALRSLTSREVIAGSQTYFFTVDLQRTWLQKHRRLDWVKDQLAETVEQWNRSAEPLPEARRTAIGKTLRARPASAGNGTVIPAGPVAREVPQHRPGLAARVEPAQPGDETADVLAEVVRDQWARAAADRRLLQPEPIPVLWGRPTEPLAGPVSAAASSRQFPPLPGLSPVTKEQLQQGGLGDLHRVYGGLGSGRLIIAGAPGAGKSATAVLLLLAALRHREQVSAEQRRLVPVPVLFTLHGWNPAAQRFQDWLAIRLQQAYPLFTARHGRAKALALARSGKIAVILDGLDEIPEELRPLALQSLSRQATCRLVILTRSAEMAAAAQQSLLAGAVALELQPIDPQTAADYLTRVHLDPPPPGWRELIDRLQHAAGSSPLSQALSSPLALTLVRDTLRSANDARELLDLSDANGDSLSREDIEGHLLDRVLPAAYAQVPGEPQPRYELAAARRALGYLAAQMNRDGTRDLAWWQVAAWSSRSVRAAVTGLVVGSITGLLTGVAIGVVAGRRAGVIAGIVAGHGTGLVIGLLVGMGTALAAGPGAELVARARSRMVSGSPQRVASPRWRQLFAPGALGTGLVAGLAVGLGFAAGFGTRFGLVAGIGFALGAWLVAGLVGSLSRPVAVDSSPLDPVASWRADKAFGRLAGLLAGVLAGLLTGMVVGTVTGLGEAVVAGAAAGQGLAVGLTDGVVAGLGAGLGVGLGVGLTYPDTWAASVAFAQLARRQGMPFRLMRFLEDAHRRDVLRAVGPIYQFRHARLQDRLSSQATLDARLAALRAGDPRLIWWVRSAVACTLAGAALGVVVDWRLGLAAAALAGGAYSLYRARTTAAGPAGQAAQPTIAPLERPGQPGQRDHLRRLGWVWATGALIAFSLAPVVAFAPKAPSTVSAAALGRYRIRVTWPASQYATGYRIDNGCPNGGGCGPGGSLAKTTGPITTAEFATTPGTHQCFEVQAFNSLGTSGWSNYGCTSTRPLSVPGTRAWTDSGVNVPAGITLGIIATGAVSLSQGHFVTPAGSPSCVPARDHPGARFPAPRLPCWSLIARIGTGAPFEVGTAANVTTTAGRLYVGMNADTFSHNSGGWTVDINEGGWRGVTVLVPANAGWVDTGIAVSPGDAVHIAASGSWTPNGQDYTGPAGFGPSVRSPDNYLNITDLGACQDCASTNYPEWAALMSYTGGSPPEPGSYTSADVKRQASKIGYVGSHLNTASWPNTGELWLGMNDDAYSAYTVDNSGQVTATITITPANPVGTVTLVPLR